MDQQFQSMYSDYRMDGSEVFQYYLAMQIEGKVIKNPNWGVLGLKLKLMQVCLIKLKPLLIYLMHEWVVLSTSLDFINDWLSLILALQADCIMVPLKMG